MATETAPRPERRTQAARRAETELRLLEAALGLIAEGGTRSMTLARVGAAAGYSRGIVTHQFGSREELLARAARYAQASLPAPETELRGLDRLLLVVRAYLGELGQQGPMTRAFLQMWAEAVTAEPALRDVFVERDEHFRALLAGYVVEGLDNGSVRPGTDPDATAGLLVTQLRGAGLRLMLTGDRAGYDRTGAALLTLLRQGLAANPVRPGPTLLP